MKELIVAAQALTNAAFKIANHSIVGNNETSAKDAEKLTTAEIRQKIETSALPDEDKKYLSLMNNEEIYIFAREIVISLAQRELKNPLNP